MIRAAAVADVGVVLCELNECVSTMAVAEKRVGVGAVSTIVVVSSWIVEGGIGVLIAA